MKNNYVPIMFVLLKTVCIACILKAMLNFSALCDAGFIQWEMVERTMFFTPAEDIVTFLKTILLFPILGIWLLKISPSYHLKIFWGFFLGVIVITKSIYHWFPFGSTGVLVWIETISCGIFGGWSMYLWLQNRNTLKQ